MDQNEILFSKSGGGGGGGGDGGCGGGGGNNGQSGNEGFIDRSKVRILLCDNDSKSSQEVFTLLCKCSYQVTSVRSPRQVIDALNAEGPDIDIILSEVDLPMAKGLKMLKYIMRDKELRRIPVIMMSAQDEVSLVVKCIRLGAADYLVKPLRTNELLNLWTHMWRRRRMLGLAEKNILIYDLDLAASDPSDANTNSTTLFSDDTDEKSRKNIYPDTSLATQVVETDAAITPRAVEMHVVNSSDHHRDVPESNLQQGKITSGPKKSELKIGQSSAFFTYVKSSMLRSSAQGVAVPVDENPPQLSNIQRNIFSCDKEADYQNISHINENAPQGLRVEKEISPWSEHAVDDTQGYLHTQVQEYHSHGDDIPSSTTAPDSLYMNRSSASPLPLEFSQQRNSKEELPEQHMHLHPGSSSSHPSDVSAYNTHSAYPYYIPGAMNQVMMSSAASMYQTNLSDMQNHSSAFLPQYNHHIQHYPAHHVPGIAPFPYYPVSVCLQSRQMPLTMHHPWSANGGSSSNDQKVHKVDRREAALLKFRQKRKERCFDKKIRYVNRKRLAERRPRVRGQFVRKINGIDVDLNGQPTSADFDDDEEEDEEEDQTPRESYPDNDSSVFHG